MSAYLTEAKIPEKRMLKSTQKKIPLKNQDIVDCFNILNQDKKLLKKGNFYLKRKNEKKDLPYVEENELKMKKYFKILLKNIKNENIITQKIIFIIF